MKNLLRTSLFLGMMAIVGGATAQNSGTHPNKHQEPKLHGTDMALYQVSQNESEQNAQGIERAKARVEFQRACETDRTSRECVLAKERMETLRAARQEERRKGIQENGIPRHDGQNKNHQDMMMNHHDTNRDGVVSRAEFEQSTQERFEKMDANKNGVIDSGDKTARKAHKAAKAKAKH